MAGAFYLRIPPNSPPGSAPETSWFDARDQTYGRGMLADVGRRAAGCRVVALAPARDVLLLDAQLPTRNRQRLMKALPYALEEQFAADVESLHFAFAPLVEKGKATVAVAARERMEQWQALLEQSGLKPQAILPESLALALEGDGWTLLVEADQALLRTAPLAATALPREELDTLLRLSLSEVEAAPARLYYHNASGDPETDEVVRRFCEEMGVALVAAETRSRIPVAYRGIDQTPAIDLMQGEFSRKDRLTRHWRPWRPVAALLSLFLLLQLAGAAADYMELSRQDSRLTEEIEAVYRTAFPDSRNLVDPRFQMEQHLAALTLGDQQDDFLSLLAKVGPLLKQAPSFEMESLRYRNATLEIDMGIKDFQALDALKAALQGVDGVSASIATANAEAGKVRSQLRITRTGK